MKFFYFLLFFIISTCLSYTHIKKTFNLTSYNGYFDFNSGYVTSKRVLSSFNKNGNFIAAFLYQGFIDHFFQSVLLAQIYNSQAEPIYPTTIIRNFTNNDNLNTFDFFLLVLDDDSFVVSFQLHIGWINNLDSYNHSCILFDAFGNKKTEVFTNRTSNCTKLFSVTALTNGNFLILFNRFCIKNFWLQVEIYDSEGSMIHLFPLQISVSDQKGNPIFYLNFTSDSGFYIIYSASISIQSTIYDYYYSQFYFLNGTLNGPESIAEQK